MNDFQGLSFADHRLADNHYSMSIIDNLTQVHYRSHELLSSLQTMLLHRFEHIVLERPALLRLHFRLLEDIRCDSFEYGLIRALEFG